MKFLIDFLPIIAFFALYKMHGLIIATGALMVATLLQIALLKIIYKKVERTQRYTAIAVVLFGFLTLMLQDPVYIMWKPTFLFLALAFGIALSVRFGKKKYFSARLLEEKIEGNQRIWKTLDRMWIIFFLVWAAINAYIVMEYTHHLQQAAALGTNCTNFPELSDCLQAKEYEGWWVYIKTFILPIASFVLILLQVFYIYRHLKVKPPQSKE